MEYFNKKELDYLRNLGFERANDLNELTYNYPNGDKISIIHYPHQEGEIDYVSATGSIEGEMFDSFEDLVEYMEN